MEEFNLNPKEVSSIETSSEIDKTSKKDENTKAFTEFLENASYQDDNKEKSNSVLKGKNNETKDSSLFKRILNDGFDGISSNPNYKMLALLIILFINLSLFFVIGNVGKAFLRNAGIM